MNDQAATLLIAGAGAALEARESAWRAAYPNRRMIRVELAAPDQFNYDIAPLAQFSPDTHQVFLALGNHAINFSRLKVMGDIKLAGYAMERFVSPSAYVARFELGENSFVSDGVAIGIGCSARHNCFIGTRAVLGDGVQLGHSVWIEPGAIIGDGAKIGDNTTIGKAAIVGDGALVGRQCELLLAREYRGEIAEKTFFSPDFPNPVRIYRAGALARSADSRGA